MAGRHCVRAFDQPRGGSEPRKATAVGFFGIGAPKRAGLELPDILGFPKLAVTYAFGLAEHAKFVPQSAASTLKTIATVRATARTYEIHFTGEEPVDGTPCWHLTLVPLGNPGRYRLRELWVDESSYETRRLITDGNFTGKSTGSGAWTVSYAQAGNQWFLTSEVSREPVNTGVGRFDNVAVQFLDVSADPHENLDFGLSGSAKNSVLEEPPERR